MICGGRGSFFVLGTSKLAAALKKAGAPAGRAALSFTYRKEHVRAIEEAKAAETRVRRGTKAVEMSLTKRA